MNLTHVYLAESYCSLLLGCQEILDRKIYHPSTLLQHCIGLSSACLSVCQYRPKPTSYHIVHNIPHRFPVYIDVSLMFIKRVVECELMLFVVRPQVNSELGLVHHHILTIHSNYVGSLSIERPLPNTNSYLPFPPVRTTRPYHPFHGPRIIEQRSLPRYLRDREFSQALLQPISLSEKPRACWTATQHGLLPQVLRNLH